MKKTLPGLMLLAASMVAVLPQAWAQHHPAAKKSVAHHKAAPKTSADTAEHENQPDMAGFSGKDFQCELGNKLTIYESANEKNRIGLRWNKQLHELTRVQTTTGADRFENQKAGLVWIGIPAKGMLLDSKHGHQLANECKSGQQMKSAKS